MNVKITTELVQNMDQGDIIKAISRNIYKTELRLRTRTGADADNRKTMGDPSTNKVGDESLNEKKESHAKESHPPIVDGTKVVGIELVSDAKCFAGRQKVFKHYSNETNCFMKFSIYIPETEKSDEKFHVVVFLSGIMCNEQNFLFKTGFQKYASEQKLIVVGADTSPRGLDFPGDRDSPLFGRSAGWYLDATEEPWNRNYRMYSYISKELPDIIKNNFATSGKFGIIGHSMGGNGTIVIGLGNPSVFKCLTLLAPSCNPTSWGQELIFRKYLGDDEDAWKLFDASCVIGKYDGPRRDILLDQGGDDEYLDFLVPSRLKKFAEDNPNKECVTVDLNMHDGYDHSFYFVASFIEKHLKYQKTVLEKADN